MASQSHTCTCRVRSCRVKGNSNVSSQVGFRFFFTILVFFGLFLPTNTSAYGSENPLESALRRSWRKRQSRQRNVAKKRRERKKGGEKKLWRTDLGGVNGNRQH